MSEASHVCSHGLAPPKCDPSHSSPECPWCLLRIRERENAELKHELAIVHDMGCEIAIRVANFCNPRLRQEREKSNQGVSTQAKRQRRGQQQGEKRDGYSTDRDGSHEVR